MLLLQGRVYIYEFDGTAMNLQATLDGQEPGGRFGSALAMTASGNHLLIGAPGAVGTSSGSVFYFEWDGNAWNPIFSLPGTDPTDNLGTTVEILDGVGDLIAMGAPNYDSSRGYIRVYRRVFGSFWGQYGDDIVGEVGDFLGTTLSAGSSTRLVAGTASGSFKVFEFVEEQNSWIGVGTNQPSLAANVASIATTGHGEIAIGLQDESVVIYGL